MTRRVSLLALSRRCHAAAQDTGTVSGTVVDTSSQVVPGATVTLDQRGDRRRPHDDQRRPGRVHLPGRRARILHRQRRAARDSAATSRSSNVVNASGQPRSRQREARGRARSAEVVSVVAEGRDHRNQEQRLLGPADLDPDLADPEPRPRRRQPAAAAARRALRGRHRGDGRQLRHRRSPTSAACASTGTR